MGAGQLVVACDLGSTTFRALVCEITAGGGLRVLGSAVTPAAGYLDGDFVDLRTGKRSLARALREAETKADVDISAFYYNISGSHLRSVWARGQVQIGSGPRAIDQEDLDAVLAKARSLAIPFDHWILAVNPVDYAVDRVHGIVDPRGRIGSQLEVQAHLITGSRSVVRNIEHAIQTAGFAPAGRAVDVLATATALLSPEERAAGVLLVDIGGWGTQWALFRNERIIGIGRVPWGGEHMTSDLAHGLRVAPVEAERIKCDQGIVLRSIVSDETAEALFEEERPEQTPGLIAAVLEPRLEEILSLVKQDISEGRPLLGLAAGMIVTGGGSRCEGTARLCEEVFDLPVKRRYLPSWLDGDGSLGEGQWATALGLSLWAAGSSEPEDTDDEVVTGSAPWRRRLRGWLEGKRWRDHDLAS